MNSSRLAFLPWLLLAPTLGAEPAIQPAERTLRGNLQLEGVPEIPDRIEERLRAYQNTRSARFLSWHPGGEGILLSTRFGETRQVHWTRKPGGQRHQLTFFAEPVRNAEPNPQRNGFLFTRDVGGSELYQLFYFDLATESARQLTDDGSRHGSPVWSPDGRRYAYNTTKRNGTDWDLVIADLDGEHEPKTVLAAGGAWTAEEFSPDGRYLSVIRRVSAAETYPHVLEVGSGELRALDTLGKAAYSSPRFAHDGRSVYFTSNAEGEFRRLYHHDLTSGETRALPLSTRWDVEDFSLSPDGRVLAYSLNRGGPSDLRLFDLATGEPLASPDLPSGRISSFEFSPDGAHLGFSFSNPAVPGDVYSLELASHEVTRWTFSELGGLPSDQLVQPTLIHYPTFDRVDGAPREIPSFYYRPRGDGPFPVVIQIHGGPEGQSRPGFDTFRQYLIGELGIAVLTPNVRGSSGYGKEYLGLDNGFRREDSVKDIGALLDWIAAQPELDAGRVAVMGGSYGGYMVLASMVHYNDRLRAGIDVVGISNFVTFLRNTKDYRRDLRRVEYGDERDPEMRRFLEEISPTRHAAKITRPLLIAQGLNDPRVPASESEQMVAEIRRNGNQVWYVLANDEGHGFRKKTNRDYYQAAVVYFLEKFLLG